MILDFNHLKHDCLVQYYEPFTPRSVEFPIALIANVGTGGLRTEGFYIQKNGYGTYLIKKAVSSYSNNNRAADLVQEIQEVFGRSMSRLTEVFGVSRQTLYNWRSGEEPKERHYIKLQQLSLAAKTFKGSGFELTVGMLDRKIHEGKTLIALIKEGASGSFAAEKLMLATLMANKPQERLKAILGGRVNNKPRVGLIGSPHLID